MDQSRELCFPPGPRSSIISLFRCVEVPSAACNWLVVALACHALRVSLETGKSWSRDREFELRGLTGANCTVLQRGRDAR